MGTRYDSSGRVQPIEYGNLINPGTCALCNRIGRDPHEIFADLGVELEYYGMMYLCQDCCLELADFVMAVPQDRYDPMLARLKSTEHTLLEVMKQNEYLRGLLNVRIESAGIIVGEPDSDGDDDISLPEAESAAAEVDRLINEYKSEPA